MVYIKPSYQVVVTTSRHQGEAVSCFFEVCSAKKSRQETKQEVEEAGRKASVVWFILFLDYSVFFCTFFLMQTLVFFGDMGNM